MKENLCFIRTKLLALLLCLSFLLSFCCGCQKNALYTKFQNSAFDAEFVFIAPNVEFRATANISAPSTECDERDVTLVFSAPNALAGLTLRRTKGTVSLSFHGILVEDFPVDVLLRPIELLLCEGNITVLGETELDGIRYISAQLKNEKDQEIYELYFEPNTNVPKEFRTKTERLRIESFELRTP